MKIKLKKKELERVYDCLCFTIDTADFNTDKLKPLADKIASELLRKEKCN